MSIQYRLNIFGYPNAAGLNASNPGLLDQRMAIEWIQKNIAAFGGDPERTVVWGQSAGAFSADHITFAYPSDPIVKGQICDSGSASLLALQGSSSTVNPHTNFSFVASQVCSGVPPISFFPVFDGLSVEQRCVTQPLKDLDAIC